MVDIEKRVVEIEVVLTEVKARSESNTKRLNGLEETQKEQSSLIIAIEKLAMETKYMREDLNSIIQRLSKLEETNLNNSTDDLRRQNEALQKQADKWEKFKWLIVAGLITLGLGILATALNLK